MANSRKKEKRRNVDGRDGAMKERRKREDGERSGNRKSKERRTRRKGNGKKATKIGVGESGAEKKASSTGKRKIKVEKGKRRCERKEKEERVESGEDGRIVFGVVRAASDNVQNRGGKLAEAHWERDMVSNGWDGKKTKESFRNREERRTGVKYKRHRKQ